MSRRLAFWVFGATLGLYLVAAAAPSPLYAVYAADWRFGSLEVTEIFAVYAVVLLVALLLTGALSDALGRRAVVLAAIVIQLAGMAAFVAASGVEWLFAARVLQGVATGIATSALAASLVDLEPRPGLAPVVNSVAPVAGLAFGALGSAALVQYGADPLHLVYWVLVAGFVLAGAAIVAAPEPVRSRAALHIRPRVAVDPAARPAFLAALPTLIAGWGVGGFYFSLGPTLALQLARSHDRLLGGLLLFVLAGVGAVTVLALNSWPPQRAVTLGVGALVGGAAFTLLALEAASAVAFFAATAVTGVGFGLAWLGVLRSLISRASPTSRSALLAAVYIVAYLAFAIPAVVAGYLVTRIGLHDASLWYAGGIGVLALAGLGGALVERRSSA
jgi:MFS family permease